MVVDRREGRCCHGAVPDSTENHDLLSVRAALCIDGDVFDRLGVALRYLVVGLVDQAVQARLISSDPRIETLTLGPIQSVIHRPLTWPMSKRRMEELLGALSQQPPMIVHALSAGSYRTAYSIAEAFDADLVLEVSSLADCEGMMPLDRSRVGRFHAISRPLAEVLESQLQIDPDRIDVIHPGVQASQRITCFCEPQRVATILCMSPFEKGGGVDLLIEAVDLLRSRKHEVLVFLLGTGRQERALRRVVRDRKLSSWITFVRPLGDLTQAMTGADIFVHPAEDTFFTVRGLQAMGTGMVVVTCPSPVCEHYRDGETAVVCGEPTAQAIADAIEGLITDKDRAKRIAAGAVEHVRMHHAMSAMAERTAAAYRRLALHRATFSIKE